MDVCSGCGTTERDYIHPLDDGYTACCNEPLRHLTAEEGARYDEAIRCGADPEDALEAATF